MNNSLNKFIWMSINLKKFFFKRILRILFLNQVTPFLICDYFHMRFVTCGGPLSSKRRGCGTDGAS